MFTGVLCLLGCAASSLGLAIGAVFPQGDAALALGPALMIVYVITGKGHRMYVHLFQCTICCAKCHFLPCLPYHCD